MSLQAVQPQSIHLQLLGKVNLLCRILNSIALFKLAQHIIWVRRFASLTIFCLKLTQLLPHLGQGKSGNELMRELSNLGNVSRNVANPCVQGSQSQPLQQMMPGGNDGLALQKIPSVPMRPASTMSSSSGTYICPSPSVVGPCQLSQSPMPQGTVQSPNDPKTMSSCRMQQQSPGYLQPLGPGARGRSRSYCGTGPPSNSSLDCGQQPSTPTAHQNFSPAPGVHGPPEGLDDRRHSAAEASHMPENSSSSVGRKIPKPPQILSHRDALSNSPSLHSIKSKSPNSGLEPSERRSRSGSKQNAWSIGLNQSQQYKYSDTRRAVVPFSRALSYSEDTRREMLPDCSQNFRRDGNVKQNHPGQSHFSNMPYIQTPGIYGSQSTVSPTMQSTQTSLAQGTMPYQQHHWLSQSPLPTEHSTCFPPYGYPSQQRLPAFSPSPVYSPSLELQYNPTNNPMGHWPPGSQRINSTCAYGTAEGPRAEHYHNDPHLHSHEMREAFYKPATTPFYPIPGDHHQSYHGYSYQASQYHDVYGHNSSNVMPVRPANMRYTTPHYSAR